MLQAALGQLQLTQQKLEAEQRRHEDTQTLGHIGSFEAVFPDANIRWSDELYRIYGLEPQSIAVDNETFFAFVHPDDKTSMKKPLRCFSGSGKILISSTGLSEKMELYGSCTRGQRSCGMQKAKNKKCMALCWT